MLGIVGVIAFLTVLTLSLLITKLATSALAFTGLSKEAAHFQARSAFTGTGFTTGESEKVVDHPVRRRIILVLMTVRSAGLMTIIISLILSLGGSDDQARLDRLLWLVGGVLILILVSNSKYVDRSLSRMMEWTLSKWTDLDIRDYASLLQLSGNYGVMEVNVREGDWLEGKNLNDCRLPEEGVTVLGIKRDDGNYVGVPTGDTDIYSGDTLILYGRDKALRELGRRRSDTSGRIAHEKAKDEQQKHKAEQDRNERAHKIKKQKKKRTK